MYRLLIVDDEPVIADGLYDLFEDIREPELDVYKAYSGSEALGYMRKAKFDIILTDICMPDVTGLDLQVEFKRQWPHCKVIFLTGFNDFSYIQQAIRNGSVDYVLKTEGDEAILRAVNRAVAEIEREILDRQLIEKAQDSLQMASTLLGGRFLLYMIKGGSYSIEDRQRQFQELEIPLRADWPILLLLGRVELRMEEAGFSERMKTLQAIQNIGSNYLSVTAAVVPVMFDSAGIVWLVQPRMKAQLPDVTGDWDSLILFVQGNMDSIQKACRHLSGSQLSLLAGSSPIPWEKLGEKFHQLQRILIKARGLSTEALVIDSENPEFTLPSVEGRNEAAHQVIRAQLKKTGALKTLLENGQKEEFERLLREMTGAVSREPYVSGLLAGEAYLSIASILLGYINEYRLGEKIHPQLRLDALLSMEAHESWEEAVHYLRRVAELVFAQVKDDSFRNANEIFRFVRKYIEEYLGEDLSLTKISELLHFNPSYFSRLFKSVTDISYSEYVSRVKIAKAKEMLDSGRVKINEVAYALGFDESSNFTRFFKKNTGLSPQEYRDSLKG